MKKKFFMFVSFLMMVALVGFVTIKAEEPEQDEDIATLIIHFHAWDHDYENIGGHTWGIKHTVVGDLEVGAGGTLPSGTDDFGIYFDIKYVAGETAPNVGFIPVGIDSANEAAGTIEQDWDNKKSQDDVEIEVAGKPAGSITHVYVFEGTKGIQADPEKGEVSYLEANPEAVNLVLVYADPGGNYEDTIGTHSWGGWTAPVDSSAWGTPDEVFKVVGQLGTADILGSVWEVPADKATEAGLLIYAGDDDTKHTGNVNLPALPEGESYEAGDVVPAFVLNFGAGYDGQENIYITAEEIAEFSVELTTFRFDLGSIKDKVGTYAVNPKQVIAKFNRPIVTGATNAKTEEELEAVIEKIKGCFTIEEVTYDEDGNATPTGNVVPISIIVFNTSADEVSEFSMELEEPLDVEKHYQIRFLEAEPEVEEVEEEEEELEQLERTIKFVVTVPEGTEEVYVVGNFTGWAAHNTSGKMTKVEGEDNKFELVIPATEMVPQELQYKYVAGPAWSYEELDAEGEGIDNRIQNIVEGKTEYVFEDTVVQFKNEEPENPDTPEALGFSFETEIPEEEPEEPEEIELLEAVARLDLDREAPQFIFLTDFVEEEGKRIIYIKLGSEWDQALFPEYRVNDNRDGNLTSSVYVPGEPNEKRILNTGKEGDYPIILHVEDEWGHETEEEFIFRVVKELPGN